MTQMVYFEGTESPETRDNNSSRMGSKPAQAAPSTFRFGPFRLETTPGLLYCREELLPLTPKALGILTVLVRNARQVVTRNDLIEQVWGDAFVEDNNITKNISILRKVLRAEFPDIEPIQTLSKRGYQLNVAVSIGEPPGPPEAGLAGWAGPGPGREPRSLETSPPANHAPSAFPKPRTLVLLGVGALLLAGAAIKVLLTASPVRIHRIPLAVIGFHDLVGKPETAWMNRALSEMMTTELDGDSRLRTLPGDETAHLRSDLSLNDGGTLSAEALARIRRASACEYAVSGSYMVFDGKVRVDLRVQNTARPEDLLVVSFTEAETNLPDLAVKAGAEMRRHFGVAPLPASEEARHRASMPKDPDARVLYAEGLDKLRAFDPAGARVLLQGVTTREPGFAPAHAQMSAAWELLGYSQLARKEAESARDSAGNLPREERLAIDATYFQTVGQWDKATDIYRSLWTFYPDQPEFGLALAHAQTMAGKAGEAERTIARLRLDPAFRDHANVSLAAAAAANARGDVPKATAEYQAAIVQAKSQGARLAEGHAQSELALLWVKLGDSTKAQAAFLEAERLCSAVGDSGCVAEALTHQASQFRQQGQYQEALGALKKAMDIAKEDGNERQMARILNVRGVVEDSLERMDSAHATLEECLAIARKLPDLSLQAIALRRLANIETRTGNPGSAEHRYAEEAEVARQLDDKSALANALESRGRLQQRRGDLHDARDNLEAALKLRREAGDVLAISDTLGPLANLAKNQGDLPSAKRLRQEECGMVVGKRASRSSLCQLKLVEIDLYLGNAQDAEAIAARIAAQSKDTKVSAEAWRIVALSRLAFGDPAKARSAIQKAQSLALKISDLVGYGIPIEIAAGRVESASGNHRGATDLFKKAVADSKRVETQSLLLEARLALALEGIKTGNRNASTELAAVKQDADAQGFGFIASQATKKLLASR